MINLVDFMPLYQTNITTDILFSAIIRKFIVQEIIQNCEKLENW